jgi:heme-degrading monooxygenase HmoA
MIILREWRAEIRRALKQEYVDYVSSTGLPGYRSTAGNLGAVIAARDLDDERAEIVTLSWWKDKESIHAFAGEDIERARYYPEDDRYLLTRPAKVLHYESTELANKDMP